MAQVSVFTPVDQIKAKFPGLTDKQITTTIDNFKKWDINGDQKLDFHEVSKMMEKLGQTKTATEMKQMIRDASGDKNTDYLTLSDFFGMFGGGAGASTALGKIYKTSLGSKAAFFEAEIRKQAASAGPSKEELEAQKREKKLKASQARAKMRSSQIKSAEKSKTAEQKAK
eukprot:g16852.t1